MADSAVSISLSKPALRNGIMGMKGPPPKKSVRECIQGTTWGWAEERGRGGGTVRGLVPNGTAKGPVCGADSNQGRHRDAKASAGRRGLTLPVLHCPQVQHQQSGPGAGAGGWGRGLGPETQPRLHRRDSADTGKDRVPRCGLTLLMSCSLHCSSPFGGNSKPSGLAPN